MNDENVKSNEAAHAEANESEKQMTGDEIANMPLESGPDGPEVNQDGGFAEGGIVDSPPTADVVPVTGEPIEIKDEAGSCIDEGKVILCNDDVCEDDRAVDMLQAANEKADIAERKVEKLKKLMLLTDKSVSHIVGGVIQNIQWAEFLKEFPEDK